MIVTFGFIYAMPGLEVEDIHVVETARAKFVLAPVNYEERYEHTPDLARRLVEAHGVQMLELCGGLADARIVAATQAAIGAGVPVGAVHYGPESRKTILELLSASL